MDRLKKEWRETQIPRETSLRARNRAWEKIQRPVSYKRNRALAFAACAAALAAFFAIFWNAPHTLEDQTAAGAPPTAQNLPLSMPAPVPVYMDVQTDVQAGGRANVQPANQAAPEIAAAQNARNKREYSAPRKSIETVSDETVSSEVTEIASNETVSLEADNGNEPVRVVLNFVLPESGARLIWFIN